MIVFFHWTYGNRYITSSQSLASNFFVNFFYSGALLSALFVAGAHAMAGDSNPQEIQLQPNYESAVPLPQSYQYQPQPQPEPQIQHGQG